MYLGKFDILPRISSFGSTGLWWGFDSKSAVQPLYSDFPSFFQTLELASSRDSHDDARCITRHVSNDLFMADLDLAALARFLHLTEGQILRMAERGRVPGRKVGGQWKFNENEIHHWLEDRMGAAGPDDLLHMEEALTQAAQREGKKGELLDLAELLSPATIALPLAARTRGAVITAMVDLAESTGWLWDRAQMEHSIRERENLHSTALEIGVALLHARRPQAEILAQPFVCLGRTPQGIPFGNRQLTDLFFLIASTDDAGHLHVLARLSRLLSSPGFIDLLRTAESAVTLHAEIAKREQELIAGGS